MKKPKYLIVVLIIIFVVFIIFFIRNHPSLEESEYIPYQEEIIENTPSISSNRISSSDAKQLMDHEDVLLIDVRTSEEYIEKRIPNSILIPLDQLEETIKNYSKTKDQTIILYCRTGTRSMEASFLLQRLGYTNVYDLGGLNTWPYETINGAD